MTCLAHHLVYMHKVNQNGCGTCIYMYHHHDSVFFMCMCMYVHAQYTKLNLRREILETRHMKYNHAHVYTCTYYHLGGGGERGD